MHIVLKWCLLIFFFGGGAKQIWKAAATPDPRGYVPAWSGYAPPNHMRLWYGSYRAVIYCWRSSRGHHHPRQQQQHQHHSGEIDQSRSGINHTRTIALSPRAGQLGCQCHARGPQGKRGTFGMSFCIHGLLQLCETDANYQ